MMIDGPNIKYVHKCRIQTVSLYENTSMYKPNDLINTLFLISGTLSVVWRRVIVKSGLVNIFAIGNSFFDLQKAEYNHFA